MGIKKNKSLRKPKEVKNHKLLLLEIILLHSSPLVASGKGKGTGKGTQRGGSICVGVKQPHTGFDALRFSYISLAVMGKK